MPEFAKLNLVGTCYIRCKECLEVLASNIFDMFTTRLSRCLSGTSRGVRLGYTLRKTDICGWEMDDALSTII
jgi:hypothetical protein